MRLCKTISIVLSAYSSGFFYELILGEEVHSHGAEFQRCKSCTGQDLLPPPPRELALLPEACVTGFLNILPEGSVSVLVVYLLLSSPSSAL